MNCPTCHSAMTQGEISLETTLADLILGGGTLSELRFREPQRGPVTVLTQSDSKPGFQCETCRHFVIVSDFEFTDSECVVCKAMIPAGVTSCPKCGWTYEC